MGTISEKLTYLNETKQELKQAINNLGGSIDDQTTFRQYAEQLQNVYDNLPKTSYAEGSNITLSNTLKGKLDFENDIVGYGQTSQEGTPTPDNPQEIEVVRGKNRLNLENCTKLGNATRTNETSNSVELTGVGAWSNGTYIFPNFAINTNLRISLKLKSSVARTTGITIYGTNTNDTSGLTSINEDVSSLTANIEKEYSVIFNSGNYKYICMRIWTNYSTTTLDRAILEVTEIMLSEGSQATSYLPYNTIEVVERGKNKLKINDVTLTSNGVTLTVQDNYLILNGTNNGTESVFQLSNYITPFKTNSNTKLKAFQISGTASGSLVNTFFRTYSNWGNQVNVNFTQTTISSYSAELTYNNFMLALAGGTYTDYKIGIMVADNITSNDIFEPYQTPQTYQLSLGEYEFAKIGNYVDTIEYDVENDKVYKNVAIKKLVLDGSETITNDYTAFDIPLPNRAVLGEGAYCNYYIYDSRSSGMATLDNYTFAFQAVKVFIQNKDFSSVDSFKSWLSTNKPIIYYPLYTAQKEEITGTLKDQIKALYYSHSFTGTTIIEIDGQLPLIIKVRALKGE